MYGDNPLAIKRGLEAAFGSGELPLWITPIVAKWRIQAREVHNERMREEIHSGI